MNLGSPEHKAQFINEIIKTYNENIWKEEIQILEFEGLLGSLRKKKAELSLKLERKEFKSANEGKKALERAESDIEATEAAIAGLQDKKASWTKRIELIERYSESKN